MDGLNKSMYQIGSDSAFAILARSNELLKTGKDVINLGIGQPDFPTPENVVNAAKFCLKNNIRTVSFTGFNNNNSLKKNSNINYYVSSKNYNVVETVHQTALLSIVERLAT